MIEIKLFQALQRKEAEENRRIRWTEVSRRTGIPPKTILGYRNGSAGMIKLANLEMLADYFGCEPGELLGRAEAE